MKNKDRNAQKRQAISTMTPVPVRNYVNKEASLIDPLSYECTANISGMFLSFFFN